MHRGQSKFSILLCFRTALLLICILPLGKYPEVLQKASVKIIDTNTCNAQEGYYGMVLDTMLCAGYLEGNIDACQVSLDTSHIDHQLQITAIIL